MKHLVVSPLTSQQLWVAQGEDGLPLYLITCHPHRYQLFSFSAECVVSWENVFDVATYRTEPVVDGSIAQTGQLALSLLNMSEPERWRAGKKAGEVVRALFETGALTDSGFNGRRA